MQIYPAIDLQDGYCVRLLRGDFAKTTRYSKDPLEMASEWVRQGAERLHLIDLDAAAGTGDNRNAILAIKESFPDLELQIGGGLRDREQLQYWLQLNACYPIVGTLAVHQPELIAELSQSFPERLIVALDCLGDRVRIDGWREDGAPLEDVIAQLHGLPLAGVLHTDISKDGTLQGASVETAAALGRRLPVPIIMAGGVSSLADIRGAAESGAIAGVVCGKSIYENRFSLSEAIALNATIANPTTST